MICLRLALVGAAAWALHRELAALSLGDLVSHVRAVGWTSLKSIGLSVLTGTAVRLRAYARYGADVAEVAQTTASVTLTTTLGLLAAGALALAGVMPATGVIGAIMRPTAIVCALLVLGYLAWSVSGTRDAVGGSTWHIVRPSPAVAARQIFLSVVDWVLTGTVLFVLVPASSAIAYGSLLRAYMVAQMAGVTSHVPAGAGVFEIVLPSVLAQGAPSTERAGLVAALVMFRIVYYLIPLCGAIAVARSAEVLAPEAARVA
jgi:phosphatidylglycerol lysyltransferase